MLCQNRVNGYEYFNLEQGSRLSFHIVVSFNCFIRKHDEKFQRWIQGACSITLLHQHRMQHTSLVDITPKNSSLNSKMMLGDNWEPWPRGDLIMDQSHWTTKRWSLAVPLRTAGNFSFINYWFRRWLFLAILKLKSGTSPTKIISLSIRLWQAVTITLELLFTLFPSISAPL